MGGEKVGEAERENLQREERAQSAFNFLTPVVSMCMSGTVSLLTTTLAAPHMHIQTNRAQLSGIFYRPTCILCSHTCTHIHICSKPEKNVCSPASLHQSASPHALKPLPWETTQTLPVGQHWESGEDTHRVTHLPKPLTFVSSCMC